MKRIDNIVDISNFTAEREIKADEDCINPNSARLVEIVFMKMMALCRGFDSYYKDTRKLQLERKQWAQTFSREGLTEHSQIRLGLQRLENYKYPNPPQLGEFLSWCNPTLEELGLMPAEQAYQVAAKMNAQFGEVPELSMAQLEIIRYAIENTGKYELRNKPMTKTYPIFQRNYEIAIRNYIKGTFDPIPKALPDLQEETKELARQEEIQKDYSECNSYEKAMPAIKSILGILKDA